MALDGFAVAALVSEFKHTIEKGKISKIAQPERDELLITVKGNGATHRLLLSANASLPLAYLTDSNKPSPMTAPNFCMLLRKHIGSGRILSVTQPGMERVISFEIQHLNDLGDVCIKYLIIELMGKHSNIIFCDDTHMILDSIKHVSAQMSSVREVLPGRQYFIPFADNKIDPLQVTYEAFAASVFAKPMPLSKALYTSLTGFSPCMAEELIYRAGLDSDRSANCFDENEQLHLFGTFQRLMEDTSGEAFDPVIVYEGSAPVEFNVFPMEQYGDMRQDHEEHMGELLEKYYSEKSAITRIRQKSADLRHLVMTALDRNRKKYDLQSKQLKDTEKRDKYRIYGELLNTYGYGIEPGAKSAVVDNYYTGEKLTIPLDPTMTPSLNAKRYFEKYNKQKRTFEALSSLLEETRLEIEHLVSILNSLDIAMTEEDLVPIKEELTEQGYIRRKGNVKKPKITSRPLHYLSSDGFHLYVGKNNYQNEELTFQVANGGDWWFHAKGAPGSHVILKKKGRDIPDRAFEEAAALAAYYSSIKDSDKIEIDYIERKHVKKPGGAKPGFVVYYTNYSMVISPDISPLTLLPN